MRCLFKFPTLAYLVNAEKEEIVYFLRIRVSPSRSGMITASMSVRLRIMSLNSRMPLVCGSFSFAGSVT